MNERNIDIVPLTMQHPDARVVRLEPHGCPRVLEHKHGVAEEGVLEVVVVLVPLVGVEVTSTTA